MNDHAYSSFASIDSELHLLQGLIADYSSALKELQELKKNLKDLQKEKEAN